MRTKSGTVTSAKMKNTVTVTVHRSVMHPVYGKRFRVTKKFLADTNGMEVHEGDEVVITECRPLSKRKCFKVTEVTKKAPQLEEFLEGEFDDVQHDHRTGKKREEEKELSAPSQ